MKVCICNNISDKKIAQALDQGRARTVSQVFKAFESAPNCGVCVPMIRDMVKAHRQQTGGDGAEQSLTGPAGRCAPRSGRRPERRRARLAPALQPSLS